MQGFTNSKSNELLSEPELRKLVESTQRPTPEEVRRRVAVGRLLGLLTRAGNEFKLRCQYRGGPYDSTNSDKHYSCLPETNMHVYFISEGDNKTQVYVYFFETVGVFRYKGCYDQPEDYTIKRSR